MSLREEFVTLAQRPDVNITALCKRYGISRKSGYKWLARFAREGREGLADRSHRPHHSPERTPTPVEAAIVAVRGDHPVWGARKIAAYLEQQARLPAAQIPAPSTITSILRRRGCLSPEEAPKHRPAQRFEHPVPNQLWQMDFKGDFVLADTTRCYPFTVLDDHSRFALGLEACPDQHRATVQAALTGIFRCYGLPAWLLMDNGPPWGDPGGQRCTVLTVWLWRLGIQVTHSRPYHPQTQGKDERFHRTLKAEVLQGQVLADLSTCQQRFAAWRQVYNLERPHQALGFAVPASRYQVSPRTFPESLPPIEYDPDDVVRKVQDHGRFSFRGREFQVSKAFRGYPIALRPTRTDGVWDVFFCQHCVAQIDLKLPTPFDAVLPISPNTCYPCP